MRILLTFLVPFLLCADRLSIEQLFNVKTTKVAKKDLFVQKTYPAIVKLDKSEIVDIAPRFSGYVEKLYAKEPMQHIKRGDILALIYSPEVYNAKEEYKNSLKFGLDKRMTTASYLKLKLLGLPKDELKNPTKTLTITKIVAPIDGFLLKKDVYPGSFFQKGKTIFRIASNEHFWVEAQIPGKDIDFYKKCDFISAYVRNEKVKITSHKLLPIIDADSALAIVRLFVKSKDVLAGEYAKVTIREHKKSILVVPKTAVIRKNGKWYAFKVGEYEGEYEPVAVQIKPLDNRYYQLISGLKEGETIADSAMFLLDSDAQINGLYND
ncbi:efflux RND transporter periplasmic adaptor subunit [Nitratiruptor sp. SB155-2]|uniref:efflux RND transporter periplasmic adaptor subunit n=1 Tax=Nitratiruptor sp. (strain SB155-2) TaxID=387092 RepID=UPI00015870E7|nr:efflux RND transporter periplasmic adaptor subunit [Nitratiruptor sp. SB155-2]BAF70014.1 heavy metal efflux pump, CzcB family [Nitratiruptor sp. SB155-2]